MSSSRTNIDYGIGSLPVGEIIEPRQSISMEKSSKEDIARFRDFLEPTPADSNEYAQRFLHLESQSILTIFENFDLHVKDISERVECLCSEINESSFEEIKVKITPDIIPETWVIIRKNNSGLQVLLETVSSEISDWLHSVKEGLASDLWIKLGYPVSVVVSTRYSLSNLYNDVHALEGDQRS